MGGYWRIEERETNPHRSFYLANKSRYSIIFFLTLPQARKTLLSKSITINGGKKCSKFPVLLFF